MKNTIERGVRLIGAGLTLFALSKISDGRPQSIQAQDLNLQTPSSHSQVIKGDLPSNQAFDSVLKPYPDVTSQGENQEMCSQQITLFVNLRTGKDVLNNNGCPPNDGDPYMRVDPNGRFYVPPVQNNRQVEGQGK